MPTLLKSTGPTDIDGIGREIDRGSPAGLAAKIGIEHRAIERTGTGTTPNPEPPGTPVPRSPQVPGTPESSPRFYVIPAKAGIL